MKTLSLLRSMKGWLTVCLNPSGVSSSLRTTLNILSYV
jgi:hypothetical protein